MSIASDKSTINPNVLLDITSVAIVGASPGKHYFTSAIANLRNHGMEEDSIYLVNPGREEIDGKKCYPGLADLPVTPTLVMSLVGSDYVDGVLDDVIKCGVPALLVVADGFAESGGEGVARQRALAHKARAGGVVLLGPNSLGYASPRSNLAAWIGGQLPKELTSGNVALAFQSSGMLNLVMGQVGTRRIGISGAISVGNEAVLDLGDFISLYGRDTQTDVLGIVLESTTRPRALAQAMLEAYQAGTRLVVLSIGKSDRGMLNVASHAGRMATGVKVWEALFRQVGAVVVEDLADFLDTVALAVHVPPTTRTTGLALATISGGDTGLLSDMADRLGLELAEVTPQTQATLDDVLSRPHILANPLDVRNTRTSAPEVFWASLKALATDPNVDIVALRMNFGSALTPTLEKMYVDIATFLRNHGVVCAFMSRVHEVHSAPWYELFSRINTPFLISYGGALRAFAHLQQQEARRALVDTHASFEAVPEVITDLPDEVASKSWPATSEWLQKWGVSYVTSWYATDADAAVASVPEGDFPVVVKGVVPGLAHKTEYGLVKVGVADRKEAESVITAMFEKMAAISQVQDGECGVEIQAMAGGGTEFFVGAYRDPIFGPVLSFGLGGIFLEIFRDVAYAVPPISPSQVSVLLETLNGWPTLTGARGQEPCDVDALAAMISKVSEAVAADVASVAALDLNPVMVMPAGGGVVAVDAYCEEIV